MSDDRKEPPEGHVERTGSKGMTRRAALVGMAAGLGAATLAVSEAFDGPDPHSQRPKVPTLPCATLVIGGGNTAGMFQSLENDGILPGGKTWDEFLKGKKVIGIGCGAANIKDTPEEQKISIDAWCQKQDFILGDKKRISSDQKGLPFYQEKGASEISFIKDAEYNMQNLQAILKAIRDPDTCMFDFSGGDQDLQMKILDDRIKDGDDDITKKMKEAAGQIKEALKQRWMTDPNLIVYTTSCSAAALSELMMSEGEIRPPGMGWLPNLMIDMHMMRQHQEPGATRVTRLQRQMKDYLGGNPELGIKAHPDLLGIGVDEATALVLRRQCEVNRGRTVEKMTGTVVAAVDEIKLTAQVDGEDIVKNGRIEKIEFGRQGKTIIKTVEADKIRKPLGQGRFAVEIKEKRKTIEKNPDGRMTIRDEQGDIIKENEKGRLFVGNGRINATLRIHDRDGDKEIIKDAQLGWTEEKEKEGKALVLFHVVEKDDRNRFIWKVIERDEQGTLAVTDGGDDDKKKALKDAQGRELKDMQGEIALRYTAELKGIMKKGDNAVLLVAEEGRNKKLTPAPDGKYYMPRAVAPESHHVFVMGVNGTQDCVVAEDKVPKIKALSPSRPDPRISQLLSSRIRIEPGEYEKALKAMPEATRKRIEAALTSSNQMGDIATAMSR